MAGYDVYLDKTLLPVTPSDITMKINGNNSIVNLINEGEMNILKSPKLTDVSFTALLPNAEYSFAKYISGFQKASKYLDALENLKTSKKPFQFIVTRYSSSTTISKRLWNTNMTVTLEDYTVKEDKNSGGSDVIVDIKLKQYKAYTTKTFTVTTPSPTAPITIKEVRQESTTKTKTTGSGSGTTKKSYKVQIPGMSTVTVKATSVQGAITAACGSNWSGTIYVDGVSYKVEKGKIVTNNIIKQVGTKVQETIKKVTTTVTSVIDKVKQAIQKTTGTIPKTTTVTKPATNTTTKTNSLISKLLR